MNQNTSISPPISTKEEPLLLVSAFDETDKSLFTNQKGDFTFYLNKHAYIAHSCVIFKWLDSGKLLKKGKDITRGSISLNDRFNVALFQRIFKSFYGFQLVLHHRDILQAYEIITYLEVKLLLKQIYPFVVEHLSIFSIFQIADIAVQNNLQEILTYCERQFVLENFQQCRYQKFNLLKMSERGFLYVLQLHNQKLKKLSFSLSSSVIMNLTQQYCQQNNYSERKTNLLMKQILEESNFNDQSHSKKYQQESTCCTPVSITQKTDKIFNQQSQLKTNSLVFAPKKPIKTRRYSESRSILDSKQQMHSVFSELKNIKTLKKQQDEQTSNLKKEIDLVNEQLQHYLKNRQNTKDKAEDLCKKLDKISDCMSKDTAKLEKMQYFVSKLQEVQESLEGQDIEDTKEPSPSYKEYLQAMDLTESRIIICDY